VFAEFSTSRNGTKTLVRDFLNPYDTFHSGPEDSGQQHEEEDEAYSVSSGTEVSWAPACIVGGGGVNTGFAVQWTYQPVSSTSACLAGLVSGSSERGGYIDICSPLDSTRYYGRWTPPGSRWSKMR
jgi:hypothetical protein